MDARFNKRRPPDEDRPGINKDDVLLAQFLEGMNLKRGPAEEKPRGGKDVNGMKRYGSQSSLNKSPPQIVQHVKKFGSSQTVLGSHAWVPMATKTAVGFSGQTLPASRKGRPISAPVARERSSSYGSLDSSFSGGSWADSLFSAPLPPRVRRNKGYMKKPVVICVRAFQNGVRDNYARVTATGISQLLEECTAKLSLTSAARKLFLPDGTVVISPRQMAKDSDVYVSCGEPFKDPFQAMRERERLRLSSSWTMTGILFPEPKKRKPKLKASLSRQMKELAESQRRRILVFRNGEASKGVEVVANRFDEFLGDCTARLGLESAAKMLFDYKGQTIESFAQVPVLDSLLVSGNVQILGPVWVSKGEGFSAKGPYSYLSTHFQEVKNKIRIAENYKKEVENLLNGNDVSSPEVQGMKKEEAKKEKKVSEVLLETLNALHWKLNKELKRVNQKLREEESVGMAYKYQHISEINPNSRLVGVSGLRLKVHLNGGTELLPYKVPINIKEVIKAGKTKEDHMRQLLQLLSLHSGWREHVGAQNSQKWFTRAFLSDGTEVVDINQLDYDADLWLSFGDDFVPIQYEVFNIALYNSRRVNFMDRKTIMTKDPLLVMDEGQVSPRHWTAVDQAPDEVETVHCRVSRPEEGDTPGQNDLLPVAYSGIMENDILADATETNVQGGYNGADDKVGSDELRTLVRSVTTHFQDRISDDGPFLRGNDAPSPLLFPELSLASIGRNQEVGSSTTGLKAWIFSSDGFIASKRFPQLVLAIKDTKIKIEDEHNIVQGFMVSLALRNTANNYQKWVLTSEGYITAAANPELYLTDVSRSKLQICLDQPGSDQDAQVIGTSTPRVEDAPRELEERAVTSHQDQPKDTSSSDSDPGTVSDGSREESDLSDSFLDSLGLKGLKDKTLLRKKSRRRKRRERGKREMGRIREVPKMEVQKTLPEKTKDEFAFIDQLPDECRGETISLVIIPQAPAKHPLRGSQRWALQMLKQETQMATLNETLCSKWRQQRLIWPVNEANQWVVESVEGYLLPNAPKLKRLQKPKPKPTAELPVRLRVLRNGDAKEEHATTVIGPDLSNMSRNVSLSFGTAKRSDKSNDNAASSASVSDIEFRQFLEKCTTQLSLPSAARRLFSEGGKELFALSGLKKDQIVFVSSGEAWINPQMTLAEQQRRFILANLASDVTKIRHFIHLRNQTDLILQVDGPIVAGASVIIVPRPEDVDAKSTIEEEQRDDILIAERLSALEQSMMTAHQRAHIRSEERLDRLRKSLQEQYLGQESPMIENEQLEESYSNPVLARKFAPIEKHDSLSNPHINKQWIYSNGFIQLKHYPKLALGVSQDAGAKNNDSIVLCAKKVEDPSQRWNIDIDGVIHLRGKLDQAMTVATPASPKDKFSEHGEHQPMNYVGQHLILMPRLPPLYGNAHQVFILDANTGYLEAFATDLINKEITAANKSGVCTYTIHGSREIEQAGYEFVNKPKNSTQRLCDACGKAARGKGKLQKITNISQFSCAMGNAKANGIRFPGAFACLRHDIDLSYKEAESTLALWEMQLARLKHESSIRVINQELRASQITPSVRIRAFRNGDHSGRNGCLIIGTSLNQLLDQCTVRLPLHQAARRLYTVDGELITDMNQLLQPYYPQLFVKPGYESGRTEINGKRKPKRKQSDQPLLALPSSEKDEASSAHGSDQRVDKVIEYQEQNHGLHQKETSNEEGTKSDELLTRENGTSKQVSFIDEGNNDVFNSDQPLQKLDVRIPVDVWVSIGEPFIPLEASYRSTLNTLRHREEKALAMEYLEIEKHRLRQLQGRRYFGMSSQVENGMKPVVHKSWTEPTREEERVENSIHELKTHIREMGSKQRREGELQKTSARRQANDECRVYDIPHALRLYAFPNGEGSDRAVTVFATNMTELLDRAASRLDLTSAARRIFTSDGKEISNFEDLERDQCVCVTCGENYVPRRDRKHKIEMRASWSRMRRGVNSSSLPDGSFEVGVRPPHSLPSPSADLARLEVLSVSKTRKARPKTAKV